MKLSRKAEGPAATMARLFVFLQYLLPQHGLSRLVAWLAARRALKNLLIKAFVRRYRVDLSESLIEQPEQFKDFNAFFTRELKPSARPLCSVPGSILSPADGAISQLGSIRQHQLLQAKGRQYSLHDLLAGDAAMIESFENGAFLTVYLSPRDYHRVHMPMAGRLRGSWYVPGRLFSVNRVTTAAVPGLFARNERLICRFDTAAGPMAVLLVGAMIVASIETVWSGRVCPAAGRRVPRFIDHAAHTPPVELAAGAELGRFKLGSTVILLFSHGAVELDEELREDGQLRVGQAIGRQLNDQPA